MFLKIFEIQLGSEKFRVISSFGQSVTFLVKMHKVSSGLTLSTFLHEFPRLHEGIISLNFSTFSPKKTWNAQFSFFNSNKNYLRMNAWKGCVLLLGVGCCLYEEKAAGKCKNKKAYIFTSIFIWLFGNFEWIVWTTTHK